MKLNPNMTLREGHDYCERRDCDDCKFYGKPYCTLGRPYSLEFEEQSQVREVKRHARVGEYIKIVNASLCHDGYENGYIVKVIRDGGGIVDIDVPISVYMYCENTRDFSHGMNRLHMSLDISNKC